MSGVEIVMPQMGVSVEEGTVTVWHHAVGDAVSEGDPVCDITTDKVDTEIPAPADGVLTEILVAAGETVAVGAPVGRLGTSVVDGAAAPAPPGSNAAGTSAPAAASGDHTVHASLPELLSGAIIDAHAAAIATVPRTRRNGRPVVSPVARRLAAERGIDLDRVVGTGVHGRIRKVDVLAADEQAALALRPAPAAPSTPEPARGNGALPRGYDDVPHEILAPSPTRRAIAEHMIRSRRTAAHMTTEVDVDMHAVGLVRQELNAAREAAGESRISYLAFIARATCATLLEFPDLNATFDEERNIRWREINLGIAVDTPQGLLAPVIRAAQRLNVGAIADAIADLGERARARRLAPEDMRAGTFTISNPGSVGAASAMAIINQPQVGILGTPAIVRKPWVVATADGAEAIVPRPILRLALTFDHRAVDGADATRCVVSIGHKLETWDARAYA
jgi:pyruvate dehydrogenase E2 component (dihydrolipoamide acetyltransferase)